MRASRPFFDTNVLLYVLSSDSAKADRSEKLLESGGTVSVQVLYAEDMQAGLRVRDLRIVNPYA